MIVGGGVAGLTAAWRLKARLDNFVLLELERARAAPRAPDRIASSRFRGARITFPRR